jgi:hypothetical protein
MPIAVVMIAGLPAISGELPGQGIAIHVTHNRHRTAILAGATRFALR